MGEKTTQIDTGPGKGGDAGAGGLFLVTLPGLEPELAAEAARHGFAGVTAMAGGVAVDGGLAEAARANRTLRCAVRVLWRVAAFRALHLAQLDKRSRKVDWAAFLRPEGTGRVEAVCRKSRIYHHKAAAQRVAGAIADAGVPVSAEAGIVVKVRIEDDLCTISLDTTGEPLHRRGHKVFVGKAPLRETMAAAFLWRLGFDGTQAVVDPMCGSGTIPLEAAEIAAGLLPGRSRGFAWQDLAGAEAPGLSAEGAGDAAGLRDPDSKGGGAQFFGFDRDAGAVRGAAENAERAGVADLCHFACQPISDLQPPEGPPGIVLVNPPYGARIGQRKLLFGLYGSLGTALRERFAGWTVGIVTSDAGLAKATGLDLADEGRVAHGGLSVTLWTRRA